MSVPSMAVRARLLAPGLVLLAVGCGDAEVQDAAIQQEAADVLAPDGYATYDAAGYSFAYPQDWDVTELGGAGESERDVRILGPADDGAPPVISAITAADFPDAVTIEEYGQAFNALQDLQFPDREVAGSEPVEVSGATEGLLIESTYDSEFDGQPVALRELTLLVLTPDADKVTLRLGAVDAAFAEYEDVFAAVVESVVVGTP